MNYEIKTTVFSYLEDIPKQFFLSDKDRDEVKDKIVNLSFSTGRDITMRNLIDVINCIRKIANFSDEQSISFELLNNFKATSQIEVLINC